MKQVRITKTFEGTPLEVGAAIKAETELYGGQLSRPSQERKDLALIKTVNSVLTKRNHELQRRVEEQDTIIDSWKKKTVACIREIKALIAAIENLGYEVVVLKGGDIDVVKTGEKTTNELTPKNSLDGLPEPMPTIEGLDGPITEAHREHWFLTHGGDLAIVFDFRDATETVGYIIKNRGRRECDINGVRNRFYNDIPSFDDIVRYLGDNPTGYAQNNDGEWIANPPEESSNE